jgi:Ca2+-binding RTX toxin-like protein
MMPLLVRAALGALLLAVGGAALTASAVSNSTSDSSAGTFNAAITPNDLKPADCAGITVTHLQTGSGVIIGIGQRSELIVGSGAADTIDGKLGNDCIVAGGSDDDITGAQGTDVCLGGGDAGDVFATCETVVP